MKIVGMVALVAACGLLAGCGGGGGGGPETIPLGTFSAQATGGASFTLAPNVQGAVASGTRVTIYADQRTGPVNAYNTSKRLTLTLYGPVQPGTYPITATGGAGSSAAIYSETVKNNGVYTTTGIWQSTAGSITVNAADALHVEGTFTLTTRNPANGNSITWQNGRFSVSYETPPSPPT